MLTKRITAAQVLIVGLSFLSFGQIPTPIIKDVKYQHYVINYNGKWVKLTEIPPVFNTSLNLIYGLISPAAEYDSMVDFFEGKTYKRYFVASKTIDTINNISWLNGDLPQNTQDSALFRKKILYSYILYKFNETRLDEDTVRKLVMLMPDNWIEGGTKCSLRKVLFYPGSVIVNRKVINLSEVKERKIIYDKTKIYKNKKNKIRLINKNISKLKEYNGYECFRKNTVPIIIFYFDGKKERTFIVSRRCFKEQKSNRMFNMLASRIWSL